MVLDCSLAFRNGHAARSKKKRLSVESMASFAGRQPSRLWTVEECAVFAARKEFELLKLLSTDKRALATAPTVAWASRGSQDIRSRNHPMLQSLEMLAYDSNRLKVPLRARRLPVDGRRRETRRQGGLAGRSRNRNPLQPQPLQLQDTASRRRRLRLVRLPNRWLPH